MQMDEATIAIGARGFKRVGDAAADSRQCPCVLLRSEVRLMECS